MNDPDLQAQIDAAKAYEALSVPALFGQWATKVADAAQIQSGHRVLDAACGTGVLSRKVASRTGPTGYVAGVDPDPGMLAVGKELNPAVDWKQGVAEADLRGWLPVMGVVLAEEKISRIIQEAEDVLGSYVTAEGRVVFESPAHLVAAVKA